MGIKAVQVKEINVKAITKKLVIGDPWYFEEMESLRGIKNKTAEQTRRLRNMKNTTLNMNAKDLIPDDKSKFESKVFILKMVDDEDPEYTNYRIAYALYQPKARNLVELITSEDAYYADLIKTNKDLGCDTAKFIIEADGRYCSVRTGADGYYGYFMKFINQHGYCIVLDLAYDLFDINRVRDIVKTVFMH